MFGYFKGLMTRYGRKAHAIADDCAISLAAVVAFAEPAAVVATVPCVRRRLTCRWVQDPMGNGLTCIWTADEAQHVVARNRSLAEAA